MVMKKYFLKKNGHVVNHSVGNFMLIQNHIKMVGSKMYWLKVMMAYIGSNVVQELCIRFA